MNIRTDLTLTFITILFIVLSIISVVIYFFSSNYREEDFSRRLRNRAINTVKILVDVAEVNAELLRRMERNNPASLPNQYIVIYNNRNQELYSSEGKQLIEVDNDLLHQIRVKQEVRFRSTQFEVLGFRYSDQNGSYTIIAAATDVYGLNALKNLRNIIIVTFFCAMVLVSILGWLYAGKMVMPIARIVKRVDNITEANLNERLDEGNRKDELSKLAQTFNRMLGRLQSAFFSQKNFIANASHEIKTPLTLMSAEIDVTLLQDRDKEYYVNVLRSVLNGLKGLNKLSTQLLLLAQASVDRPDKNFSLIRIDDILWEVKEDLVKANYNYIVNIHFDLNLNDASFLMEADEQLIKVAILNLMDNGCKYSDDNTVNITLSAQQNKYITIEFMNNGEWIDSENIEKIFAPFFRGNKKNVKGFGIGLSLVSGVIKLHSGEIFVRSTAFKQTHFVVTLPLKRQTIGPST